MKRIWIPLMSLLFVFSPGCKNAGKKNADSKGILNGKDGATSQTMADSLYHQVLNEHEAGMKGWMKIEGRQKQIKNLLDSIAKLPSKTQPSLEILKAKLNEATAELGDA